MALAESSAGDESSIRALELANILSRYDRFIYSLPIYLKAIELSKRTAVAADAADAPCALNELALAYERDGQYDNAEHYFQECIKSGARKPQKDWFYAAYLSNLANLFFYKHRYADSEKLYQEALLIRQKEFGPDFPTTILSMNQLANVYLHESKYEAAEHLCLKAVKFKTKVLEIDGFLVASALDNLGRSYVGQKRYDEAILVYIEALRICKTAEIENQKNLSAIGVETASLRFDINTAFDCRPSTESLGDQLLAIKRITRLANPKLPAN
jgi:tetratricopeptide (TPR) repeat protein